jgi:hypothetical protein
MEFVNLTPFSAQAYTAIDVQDRQYRVIAMSVAYRLQPDPLQAGHWQPEIIDEDSPPLCMADEAFGEMNASSTRCESDLAPFKPRCDVIVNASAHAPGGIPVRHFAVSLRLRQPNTMAPLPPPPQPLNPYMPLDRAQQAAWQRELQRARRSLLPGRVLLDKTLIVTGSRHFQKKFLLTRLALSLMRWGSLGLLQLNPWRLTQARRFALLPLRYEAAWGGQCRINARDNRHLAPENSKQARPLADHPALAKRVAKKHRLSPEQMADHPDVGAPEARQAIAHATCETNPLGLGFARQWFLKASRLKSLPAPRIETPSAPVTASLFWQVARDRHQKPIPPAGLGSLGRAWTPRRQKAGTYDDAWLDQRWPNLPKDFNFSYWNAAPADQQIDYPQGDEIIELSNLVPHDTPGSQVDAKGNTTLKIALPGHRAFVLAHFQNSALYPLRTIIDTLRLDLDHPEGPRLTCLWRTLVPAELPVAKLEARFELDPQAPLIRLAEREAA